MASLPVRPRSSVKPLRSRVNVLPLTVSRVSLACAVTSLVSVMVAPETALSIIYCSSAQSEFNSAVRVAANAVDTNDGRKGTVPSASISARNRQTVFLKFFMGNLFIEYVIFYASRRNLFSNSSAGSGREK